MLRMHLLTTGRSAVVLSAGSRALSEEDVPAVSHPASSIEIGTVTSCTLPTAPLTASDFSALRQPRRGFGVKKSLANRLLIFNSAGFPMEPLEWLPCSYQAVFFIKLVFIPSSAFNHDYPFSCFVISSPLRRKLRLPLKSSRWLAKRFVLSFLGVMIGDGPCLRLSENHNNLQHRVQEKEKILSC